MRGILQADTDFLFSDIEGGDHPELKAMPAAVFGSYKECYIPKPIPSKVIPRFLHIHSLAMFGDLADIRIREVIAARKVSEWI